MGRKDTYFKYESRLKEVAVQMNALQESLQALNKEYYNIMQYFRTQKQRGLISTDEYNRLATLYKYKK